MNGDTGDTATTPTGTTIPTPVRRSARARKPNSRFADDEVDSCFKKIVSGLSSPECTSVPSPGRPRKATARRKDSRSEEVEERSERGRKDSKDDEEVEERGRKTSEECEEKKRKERSEELEIKSEHGKKPSQNEERSEEENDSRKEDMEERRRKDSQTDESTERKDKTPPAEDKPPSHSLPNGLETSKETSEECTRVTRSGRPVEELRRKTRKRGKGKEEQEQESPPESKGESETLEPSQDSTSTIIDKDEECDEGGERMSHTTPELIVVCDGGNAVSNSDGAKKLDECSVQCSNESDGMLQDESDLTTERITDNSEEGSTTSQDGLVTSSSSSSSTPSSPSSVVSMANGDADTVSSFATGVKEAVTTTTTTAATTSIPTTTTVTTTPATITATTTTTTTITTTAITNPSTTTITTTTHSKQSPPAPVPPPLPLDGPTDPRLHRGTRGSPRILLGGRMLPQTQGGVNTGPPTPSSPPLPPDTPTRKGGAVLVQGVRRSSRDTPKDTPREPQEVRSPKVMCENIPLPPDLSASPKHGRQAEETLRKMGGKRERREKEESTPASQKATEDKEEVPSSPLSKRRKEMAAAEETKEDDTKRKRLADAKEEDKRKRRKVEETEEKEENTPKTTPTLPPSTDENKPTVLIPAAAPPLPPLPKKITPGLQNSPKTRRESRESRESISSPRDNPREKDSPRRNRESLRSMNKTVTLDAAMKDTKGANSLRPDADFDKGEEGAKEGCEGSVGKAGRNMKVKEEGPKGVKGKDTGKSDRDAFKGKEDVVKSTSVEKEVVKSDGDKSKDSPAKSARSEKEVLKSERTTVKSTTVKSKEEAIKSNKTEKDNSKGKEEAPRNKDDTVKSVKGEREVTKTEKVTSDKNQEPGQPPEDTNTLPGLFLPTQDTETAGGGGMGVFLGLSTSTTIPFLEDTPSTTTSEEIPGLSILASSDSPRPRMPPKKEQSHRSWFAIGSNRRNQNTEKTETVDEASGDSKEEKEVEVVEEIALPDEKEEEEKKEEKEEEEEEEPMEVTTEVKEEETKEEEEEVVVEEEKKLTEEEIEQKRKEEEERAARNRAVVEERLKSFSHLQENVYIGERKRSKRNKEVRRMVCDCSLTKEEMERGEVGCGDDCLNRLLMIECGSRCPLGDHCINKRFLHRQYGDVEVFNTEEKGCGLRALSDLSPGTFIMEYVGEVFDTREFKRRRKEYARDMRDHFYFMALKSDQLIDATMMGNISRFINHSCDPNAETQKWTVNGDLRIGFFSKRYISAGEEINFDYRLERYGREPQRCYCGVSMCRGWLGEAPDEQTKEEKDEARKEERDRRKREERRAFFEDIDLEEEIEKLNSHKLRNRQDTLNLSRLMVRAEDLTSRILLLQLLQTGESACRRLFLDYHGLKVLWSWMADLGVSQQHTLLKVEIMQTLEVLPITNKTQLTDSRVLSLVERWSGQGGYTTSSTTSSSLSPPPSPPPKTEEVPLPTPAPNLAAEPDPNKKSSDTSEESDSETDPKVAIEASSADDSSLDSEAENPKASAEEESSDSNDAKDATTTTTTTTTTTAATEDKRVERLSDEEKEAQELLELHNTMVALAKKLLDAWKNLKEFFRIPKKERIEMMKEHEREVDRGYKEYLDQASESDRDKDRDRYNRREHHYDRRRRSPDRDKERYSRGRGGPREDRSSDSPKMSKEQRRQLFELKVQQQEEEAKQRKMQEEMWTMHVDRCRLLGHDPYLTPIFDPTYQYFWDPVAANWQPYTGSGEMPALSTSSPTQGHEGTPPHGAKLLSIPLPGEATTGLDGAAAAMAVEGTETPSAITIHLPPRWHLARDATDHVYFYHVKTRVSQWEPPVMLNSGLGSDSSSDSSSDSDSDSSSTTDSEDFSTEEEEEEEEEAAVAVTTEVSDEKMIRRPKGTKRRRSEALVQERVISPILEVDKEAARRERREAKERAREEARQERQEERNTRSQKEEQSQSQPQQQQQEQAEGGEGAAIVAAAVASAPVERERDRDRERERERRSERHEARAKREKVKSKERAASAIADNSDAARKIKDTFRSKMATFIVSVLNPYRRSDCREGKITCTEDFKYLARKLTHFVMVKELKQLHSIEALECSDSVKHKTRDFVRKYMSKYGSVFKRDPNDTKEY